MKLGNTGRARMKVHALNAEGLQGSAELAASAAAKGSLSGRSSGAERQRELP